MILQALRHQFTGPPQRATWGPQAVRVRWWHNPLGWWPLLVKAECRHEAVKVVARCLPVEGGVARLAYPAHPCNLVPDRIAAINMITRLG